jgi:hypothetical protein
MTIELPALDGTSPLALFAAVGILEVLTDRGGDARIVWRDSGRWTPSVEGVDFGFAGLVEILSADRESCQKDPALLLEYESKGKLKRDLKPPPSLFREYLLSLADSATPDMRRSVDWGAAFGSEMVTASTTGDTKPTAFDFTAGQQQFLGMARQLAEQVTVADFEEALLGPWLYERKLPVFDWGATGGRDYALRASDPSTDKKRGVPGADWLALRGLVALPVFPRGNRLSTTGCSGGWKVGSFRWPLWTVELKRDLVRALLRIDVEAMSPQERRARGIGVVVRCDIKRPDRYGSFSPAAVV